MIACRYSVPQICRHIGADSLGYLPLEALGRLAGGGGFCSACFNGDYPTHIPKDIRKDWMTQIDDGKGME